MELLGVPLETFNIVLLGMLLGALFLQTLLNVEMAGTLAKFTTFLGAWMGLIFGFFFTYKMRFFIVPITQKDIVPIIGKIGYFVPLPSKVFLVWILGSGLLTFLLWMLNDDFLGKWNKYTNFFIVAMIAVMGWGSYVKLVL